MLFAVNSRAKLNILFPKMKFKFIFMHSFIPQPQDSFDDYVSRYLLAKSELDSFL